jgi:uncharacterized RDD family membrane protein YckC
VELDDRLTLPSAEGIDVELSLAGVGSRSVAQLIDLAIEAGVVALVTFLAASAGELGAAVVPVVAFAVFLGYPIAFEGFNGGRTIGKAIVGLTVVGADGAPAGFLAVVTRNVVRFVDLLPGTYLVGLIAVLATERNQRVGDLAASTLVVHRRRAVRASAPELGWAPSPSLLAADLALADMARWDLSAVTADELSAVRSFLSRRGELAPEARAQLAQAFAAQLAPKVAGVPLDGPPELLLERIVAAKLSR